LDEPRRIARLEDLDALLVDLGGVMVRVIVRRFFARLAEVRAPGPPEARDVVFAEEAYHRFARGEIGAGEFHAALEGRLGFRWPFDSFAAAWSDVFEEIPESVEAVTRMRGLRPLYVLSNTDALHFDHLRRRWEWMRRFDGYHLSFEVGVEKPDPRFFRSFLERSGLAPARCLYVDDLQPNVDAARAAGLAAIRQDDPGVLGRAVAGLLDGRG
jgi:putative hydrolase of the HAD superfamily